MWYNQKKLYEVIHMIKEKLRSQILGGALQDYGPYLAGVYRGFYITVDLPAQYVVRINASSPNDEGNAALKAFAEQQKTTNKHLNNIAAYNHSIVLAIRTPNLSKNLPTVLNGIIEPIINYMVNGMYSSGCENCGNALEQIHCYEINGQHHYICEACEGDIQGSLQEQQDITIAQKSNLVPGLVGAFLGSLLGCILWVLIYRLGYIAGIAGAVTAICAMKGYEMFGKHLDKKGVIGSVIIMVIMIFFANKIAWSWEAYSALKEYDYTFSDCFRALGEILKVTESTASYYGDLAIGYVLTLVASYRNIIGAFKASTGSYTFKKADK